MTTEYILLSPGLSQAISLARLLRRYAPDARVVAGCTGRERPATMRLYHEARVLDYSNLEDVTSDNSILIPTGASSTIAMAKQGLSCTLGRITFCPESTQVGDKRYLLGRAQSLGLPIPLTWDSFGDIPEDIRGVFYKPAIEGLIGVRRGAQTKQQIPEFTRNSDYIFQELIGSPGTYGVAFLASQGKILCAEQHREKYSYPRQGGSASVIEAFDDPRLLEYSSKLVQALNYSGWGLTEFKYCSQRKDYLLMEMNAKFWASLEFALQRNSQFAKELFDIETRFKKPDGLVWPARLLASGLTSVVRSIPDLARYPWVIEPNGLRTVFSAWLPGWAKRLIVESQASPQHPLGGQD